MAKKSIEERESEAAAILDEIAALREKVERLDSASNSLESLISDDIYVFKEGWEGLLDGVESGTEFEGGKERTFIDTSSELIYTDIQKYTDSLNQINDDIMEEIHNIQAQIAELESKYNSVDPSALDYVADFFGLY
jgi:prefoldin subunit 5